MKTIHKFVLPNPTDDNNPLHVTMPVGAEILAIQPQSYHGDICVWALVDTEAAGHIVRRIWVIGTGEPMPGVTLKFITTIQLDGGRRVFHIFEEIY